MTTPPSLRDLYIDPSAAWSFIPPTLNSQHSPSPPLPPPNSSHAFTYQWSNKPSQNSIFDLSPTLDLSEPSGVNIVHLLRAFAASAILQYTSSAIVMPWEVGKLLLQVQWVPRDAGDPEPSFDPYEDENDDALSESSNDNESYFHDPNTPIAGRPIGRTDEQGYIVRRSVLEEGTRPEYIIPVGSADGVWGMIKRIGRFKGEGYLALWKGLLTSCVTEVLSSTLQPLINGFLQSLFFPSMSPFHQPPLILPVTSHILTGFILSPFDLIRTRLIVQSFIARHRQYSGPIDALHQILRDEGGLKSIYLHPHLLIPALLDNALRPVVSLALPGVVATYFGGGYINEDTHPLAWGMAELVGSFVGLLVTLPIETVRRRLQVQTRGTAKPLKGCVELRPAPYNGVVDALWHIATEERSDLPIVRRPTRVRRGSDSRKGKEKEEEVEEGRWTRQTGIGQLYRGFGMRVGASVIVFVLSVIGGGEEETGWAEI